MAGLRIAVAQIDTVVGEILGNSQKIVSWIQRARAEGADMICFPELALTGYPPEDLLLKPDFIASNLEALEWIAEAGSGIIALVGFVDREDDIYNAACVLHQGRRVATYRKHFLPTYGVFDEDRYFQPGREGLVLTLGAVRVGVSICEDLWYPVGPIRAEALHGNAEVLVNLSSSPYAMGKRAFKERMFATRATDNAVFVVDVNRVGGQDELVFDGQSLILSPEGEVLARGKAFEEQLLLCDLEVSPLLRTRLADPRRRKDKLFDPGQTGAVRGVHLAERKDVPERLPLAADVSLPLSLEQEVLEALRLGVRAYVLNNGFREVVIGLSGGVDSALTAVIAAQALGPEAVIGVSMPSAITSTASQEDALQLAGNLGIRFLEISVAAIHETYLTTLAEAFREKEPDVTEENLQSRIRGNLLMALSNKFNWLVLTTGNKSEVSVGYCTLYGDTAGGFAVLKDVPKTLVYGLARYLNSARGRPIIPERILSRPPTAELREGQLDIDSLPPYEILDPILQAYVEEEMGIEDIIRMGFEKEIVMDVIRRVDRNGYKRRQSPPGIKITPRAFGKERRLPITNRYRME